MPSTHLSLHYHIVFGTKNHEPILQPSWRGKLHAYLGGIIRTANGIAESVGGVSDHVHLLIGLRATHCLADVLRELKSVSSGWIRDEIGVSNFAWQEGYGGFTVSASQYETVRRYIEARRASSHPYLSRGVLGIVAASQNRIRRTLSLIPSPRWGWIMLSIFHPVVSTTG